MPNHTIKDPPTAEEIAQAIELLDIYAAMAIAEEKFPTTFVAGAHCPGCEERTAAMPTDTRNRIPLNHAANTFRSVCDAAMDRVAAGASHESVDAEIRAAEDALAAAALAYAVTKGMTFGAVG